MDLKSLAARVRTDDSFHTRTHEHLFAQVLASRQAFPLSLSQAHQALGPAAARVLAAAEPDGSLPEVVTGWLAQLGRDHRRHGFPPEIYEVFSRSLAHGLGAFKLSDATFVAAARALDEACATMADAARAADAAGVPPAHTAQVVAVHRPNRRMAVIRLEAGLPVNYFPGQHLPVTTPHLPGTWRMLTPAAPATVTGQLEFHVHEAGDAAGTLMRSRPGDLWTLGSPRGEFGNFPCYNLVIVCFGVGWAAARSYLLSLTSVPGLSAAVYAVADSPGQHYDAVFQDNLTALAPWIRLRRIARAGTDPLLLGATPLPEGADVTVSSSPMEEVIASESLTRSSFVLVGPAEEVEPARRALLAAGVEPQWLEAHPWSSDWAF